jgi:hypothetical protein
MRNVAIPINNRVTTRVDLRPTRSPNQPKNAPPIGRAAKPTKFVVNARIVPANGLKLGKKSLPNTDAERRLNRKKSYHSIDVPTVLANRTGSILVGPEGFSAEETAIVLGPPTMKKHSFRKDMPTL